MARWTAQSAAFYLAAMIDGEGTVTALTARNSARAVKITNTDFDLITACVECLTALKITARVYERSAKRCVRKRTWDVNVYGRDNLERLLRLPFRCLWKKSRVEALLASYRPRRPSKGVLKKRLAAGDSLADLAAECGVTPRTVTNWLK